ncbi:hypothetical protein A2U01_0054093, partial [Trifolium medium]|nr:hypothetical protein [Trifolium medium]
TRRSSRGSGKPSTARTLEIEVTKRETRTKASHDRVNAPSEDISPSNPSNPNEMVQPSKTVVSKSTKSPITNDQTSSGHKEVTMVTSFEHFVTPSGHSNA